MNNEQIKEINEFGLLMKAEIGRQLHGMLGTKDSERFRQIVDESYLYAKNTITRHAHNVSYVQPCECKRAFDCKCVYESDCHGIEMIKSPSGKEWAIGGTKTQDRWKFCPWCGGNLITN